MASSLFSLVLFSSVRCFSVSLALFSFSLSVCLPLLSSHTIVGPRTLDVPRRGPALLIKITLPRSGEISAAKFMKLSRFIVLNELAFPKRSPSDKGFPVNPQDKGAEREKRGGGGGPTP